MPDPIALRIANWKRHLIDLTRRNRLLNYRPTKASTVEIVDELPQLILTRLLKGDAFQFDPKPDPENSEVALAAEGRPGPKLQGGRTLHHSGAVALESYHTDDRLQTTLLAKNLDANLLAIYRRADESLEEQGINTLFLGLGMLEWHEADSSETLSKAPVLMVPVGLKRETAASPLILTLGDDDPILNPALVEKLRLDFQITLPELPELSDDLDVDTIFEDVRQAVAGFSRWRLTSDIVLGLFSFQKFIMYRDLEKHEEILRNHPVIRSLCQQGDSPKIASLPRNVANADLDEEMSPAVAVQVLDADSSQQQAILAVKKNYDLVIEGPPGTGKSQTITNLIADALHDGKTVLFVAEKMAALDVVKTRLEHDAGLGEYVLELHSNKASKREFVEDLSRALDRTETPSPDHEEDQSRLRRLTGELRKYVSELHRPFACLGVSPYQAIAELASLHDVASTEAEIPSPLDVSTESLSRACESVSDLAQALSEIETPLEHPLRGIGLSTGGRAERSTLEIAVKRAGTAVSDLTDAAHHLAIASGLKPPRTLGEAQLLVEGAQTMARSPGAEVSVLENSRWNRMSADVEDILKTGEQYASDRADLEDRYDPAAIEVDHSDDFLSYSRHVKRGIWRLFVLDYWKVRGRILSLVKDGYRPESAEQIRRDLQKAQSTREHLLHLEASSSLGVDLFGRRWNGPSSDWPTLRKFAEWVVEFRQFALNEALAAHGLEMAAGGGIDQGDTTTAADAVTQLAERVRESIQNLKTAGALTEEAEIACDPTTSIGRLALRIAEMESGLDQLRGYSAYVAARVEAASTIAGAFVSSALEARIPAENLVSAFRKRFFDLWVEGALQDRPALARFHASQHEKRVQDFQALDRKSLQMAEDRTRSALNVKRQALVGPDLIDQLQTLQRESRKRSRILPVRKLLKKVPDAVQCIKPCFMMSPLSVAQFLDASALTFDLIVFDEASQIPPSDAIGAIMRAKQVVVVGDSKQLPPTNFFGVHLDDVDKSEEEELEQLEDLESILDEVATSGIPSMRLKWHYRSQHQSLIRFSNEEFYSDDPLYVFPAAVGDNPNLGLKFEYVEDGVYEGGGRNQMEARRVADAVVDHIHLQPNLSLGVGTFGIKQQHLILDELDRRRRQEPTIEWFFQQQGEKKFFVKNLENIQGDDRDVIFLSVTYGPDSAGVLRRSFGPINSEGGWRRLNVITTRAKILMRVFSSMHGDEIDTAGVSAGAVYLHQYLKFAETGEYPAAKIPQGEADSPFEVSVKNALIQKGYRVVSQVGDAGYRIDLGVVDQDLPGRYICGIECDGATYHSAATVRDRDRLRQQVLEVRGWEIHRVWSTDWFHDRRSQIERLVRLVEESDNRLKRGERKRTIPDAIRRDPPAVTVTLPDEEESYRPSVEEIQIPFYQMTETALIGSAEDFYLSSVPSVARVVERVLVVEAPIHISELARRVAGFWGMSKAGSQIVGRVEKAVKHLLKSGTLTAEDDFVWLDDGRGVEVRSRDVPGQTFSSDHIAPMEICEAVRILLRHRAPLLPDDVIRETARILGFSRTGPKLRQRIEAAQKTLIANGEIRPGGRGLHLADEPTMEAEPPIS